MKFSILLFCFLLISSMGLFSQEKYTASELLVQWNDLGVETMKTDGINPVLATRIFLYPNIAAYEAICARSPKHESFQGRLIGIEKLPLAPKKYLKEIAAITAYYQVMLQLNYRADLCTKLYQSQMDFLANKLDKKNIEQSKIYGENLAKEILSWAEKDNYKETKGMSRHAVDQKTAGAWIPTPPEYRPALEPHWGKLRPLLITDFDTFTAPFEIEYSEAVNSEFYALAKEVYDTSLAITADQKHRALFWDDNPDLNNFFGHIPNPRRHINPTAHWMKIIGQVLRKEQLPIENTAEIYAAAAIAFYEANLICWHDKYKYNLIRPVTYIRKHIDAEWMPILVTPPFPEHSSGHSACSASCATVLTELLGEDYAFVDSSHANTSLGLRSFSSFNHAALEVSLSRFYGGIHYKTAVIGGTEQGNKIGKEIIKRLKLGQNEK